MSGELQRFKRHDTAADRLPSNVRARLDRELQRVVVVIDSDPQAGKRVAQEAPQGWQVRPFTTSLEAVSAVVAAPPILVICAVRVGPMIDGIALLRELREVRPHVRRVLMGDPKGDGIAFMRAVNEAGVYRFLPKPVERKDLQEMFDAALAVRRRELAAEYLVQDIQAQNRQLQAARQALTLREAHLLHTERLAVLGRLTDGLAAGVEPVLRKLRGVVDELSVSAPPEDQDLLSMGTDSVEALGDILSEINRFTRDEAIRLQLDEVDLAHLLRRAVKFASFDRRLKRRRVMEDLATDLQPVAVDRRKLRQVLLNLLRNAAEATGDGAKIVVSLRGLPDDKIEIAVADEGTGIPHEVADHVFDEFFTTKGQEGLGLGLSLCRTIIEEHGGTISCSSLPGEGSTFRVILPASRET